MSPQDFGLTLALFPSPPSTLPPSPRNSNNTDSNKSMALGSTTPAAPSSSRPELALYYFNSPTMLPHQKKPIPLMPSNTSNLVDVVMLAEDADGKGPAEPAPRKRERSPLPSDSEKGNKRKTPRKMRSSPFLAAATGHWFQAARSLSPSSLSTAVTTAPGTSPKAADGTITGVRNGDTARTTTTLNATTSSNNNVNSAEMETVKVISRAVRQRVAQSSSSSTAASAIAVDTAASVRSVEVECTSPSTSAPIPPAPSSSSSKSPFKKRRRVEKTQRPSSPLRNPPLSASDLPIASSSRAPSSSPAAAPSSPAKAKKPSKAKPTAWEKRPLLQKVILKEFERTPHGAEILRRGAKAGIAFLEEQRRLLEATGGRENQSPKSAAGRKSTSSDEAVEVDGVIVKSRSKEVSSMRHWGRIVKTALAGPLKEMAGPMAGDGRPPMPMIRAW
ncbi:hypothetical protein FRC04_002862 [Tulasnella sp. 424]|nr:hypothetical protein FRC04_002862 [Tulasnella sp. 424]KAG8974139.1 hypothetical protein FRC05_007887 [Tulasnella sp. 425]